MKRPAKEIISDLARRVATEIARFVRPGETYAYLDFPDHSNVGDSAIWVGASKALLGVVGKPPSYVCTWRNLNVDDLKAAVGSGPIFLNGGGNFGDIYPYYQDFRERIITGFPNNAVVQLPQSIKYRDLSTVDRTAKLIASHRNFHLLVRDRNSLKFAQENFECPVSLVPDCAFAMGSLRRAGSTRSQILLLLRQDDEIASYDRSSFEGVGPIVDWLEEPKDVPARALRRTRATAMLKLALRQRERHVLYYDALAGLRLARGIEILSRGEKVITDRLHGHIMSTLLDIPHVALDNDYGKISAYIREWTKDYEFLQQAKSAEEAIDLAHSAA